MDVAHSLRQSLLGQLSSGAWAPGQRLPTERALSEQFGLSRGTVRRVLQELKTQRLISQTVGSGTYVSEQAPAVLGTGTVATPALDGSSPAELMAARLALEPAIIEMVVGNATAADFSRMDDCLSKAESAQTLEAFEHWDAALHEAVALATHNGVMVATFRMLSAMRTQGEWGVLKRRSATPRRRQAYQAEHRALVDALRQRDADTARRRCVEHLLHVRRNLLGS